MTYSEALISLRACSLRTKQDTTRQLRCIQFWRRMLHSLEGQLCSDRKRHVVFTERRQTSRLIRTFVRKLIKEIGFSWKKCATNRCIAMERSEYIYAVLDGDNYLRLEEGRLMFYTDAWRICILSKQWKNAVIFCNVKTIKNNCLQI